MELRIENVPDDVVRAVKVEAMAAGVTLRSLVIGFLERTAAGEVEADQSAPEPRKQSATASQRTRSAVSGQARATKQARKAVAGGSRPPMAREGGVVAPVGDVTRCPHGLTWHPGCNA
jgi:hypothetical protein